MHVLRDFASPLPPRSSPGVLALGAFDGVHVGHQYLLRELGEWARERGWAPRVVTFDRHPLEVLTGKAPRQILSLEHRLQLFARLGIADTLVVTFDRALSLWSAEDFVRRIVVGALRGQGLLLGFDSAFGHQRQGTFEYLRARAGDLGIELRQAGIARLAEERVSSTLVRNALEAGDLNRLRQLLGRTFSLLGCVRQGDGRGRQIGVPTANLDIDGAGLPPLGVYFAEVSRLGSSFASSLADSALPPQRLAAIVNVGKRPTFKDPGQASPVVEVHLLDWHENLYGEYLEVHLLECHRGEVKFASAAELVAQIHRDIAACRAHFRERRV